MQKYVFTTLFSLLFALTMVSPSSAQIVVDNCNTGAFTQTGSGSLNDLSASGAIGGTRDIRLTNTNFGQMSLEYCHRVFIA